MLVKSQSNADSILPNMLKNNYDWLLQTDRIIICHSPIQHDNEQLLKTANHIPVNIIQQIKAKPLSTGITYYLPHYSNDYTVLAFHSSLRVCLTADIKSTQIP